MSDRIKIPSILPVKSDFVFRLIFGDQRNVDILSGFLRPILRIPDTEYEKLTIVDPHVKKEFKDDKYGILDVKVHTKSGQVIHVEVQVHEILEMIERTLFYQSKMVTEQIGSGEDWHLIKRTVSIIIADFTLIPHGNKYHHQFRYRTDDGLELTDLTEINTLELKKLPTDSDNTELWDWMEFIKTNDEEVLNMLAERSPQMKKAVGVLKELSTDQRTRMLYEEREIARRDEASRMRGARREGRAEGLIEVARNLVGMNIPFNQIIQATGLTREELEALQQ